MDNKTLRCKELMAQGVLGDELISKLCEEFKISPFAADWIRKDAERKEETPEPKRAINITSREDHLSARMDIIEDAMQRGDNDLALKTLQDIAKLQNTYSEAQDKKLEIVFKFPDPQGYKPMTREILNKAMEMLGASNTTV